MTKSSVFRSGGSGGIKPLNAPRVVYVRTDSAGTPVAVQVPPAITSPHARNPHPNPRLAPGVRGALGRAGSSAGHARARERGQANPPSPKGRELEGGLVRGREGGSNAPTAPLVSDGRWVKVTKVDDLWKVNDEWWRGAGEEIARLYYMIRLENSQQLTVYLDLITNNWYRQAG